MGGRQGPSGAEGQRFTSMQLRHPVPKPQADPGTGLCRGWWGLTTVTALSNSSGRTLVPTESSRLQMVNSALPGYLGNPWPRPMGT